jgi:hypothetical protein
MDRVTRTAEVMCLRYIHSPEEHRNIAVLLLDREDDSLRIRFTADWTDCDNTTLNIVANLAADLHFKAQQLGASDFVAYFRNTLSNTLCISDEQPIVSDDLEAEMDRLAEILITRYPNPVGTGGTRVFTHSDDRAARNGYIGRATAPPPLVLTPARQPWIADLGYAIVAGMVVMATLFASTLVFSRKESRLAQHFEASPEFEITRVNIDLPLRQSPLDLYLAMLPDTATQPFRRRGRRAVQASPTRQFVPPDEAGEPPEMALYVTPPIVTTVKANAVIVGAMSDITIAPPPAMRSTGVRRFFQTLASPFKKLGDSITN